MDKVLRARCEILSDLYNDHFGNPEWQEFFLKNDLGIYCAVSCVAGSTTLTEIGAQDVNAAYTNLCKLLNVDSEMPFTSLDHMTE